MIAAVDEEGEAGRLSGALRAFEDDDLLELECAELPAHHCEKVQFNDLVHIFAVLLALVRLFEVQVAVAEVADTVDAIPLNAAASVRGNRCRPLTYRRLPLTLGVSIVLQHHGENPTIQQHQVRRFGCINGALTPAGLGVKE